MERRCGDTWNDMEGNLYILLGDGQVWVNPIACSYGDYDNSTEIERANVRFLQSIHNNVQEFSLQDLDLRPDEVIPRPETDLLLTYDSYGGWSAWLRADNDDTAEILAALADYPVLDDGLLEQVTLEIEDEALPDIYNELIGDDVELYTNAELYQAYLTAQEETGNYPFIEGGGIYYVRIDDAFKTAFKNALERGN